MSDNRPEHEGSNQNRRLSWPPYPSAETVLAIVVIMSLMAIWMLMEVGLV